VPGAESLEGLIYQQRYVYLRVLSQLAAEAMESDDSGKSISDFSVEGWTTEDGPVWDVIVAYCDGRMDLVECKDTGIQKDDRSTFYKRIRKEVAGGVDPSKLQPTWVTDPNKQSANTLAHLEGIPIAVAGLTTFPVFNTAWKNVTTTERAVQEAFDCLCDVSLQPEQSDSIGTDDSDEAESKTRPLSFAEAKSVLANLKVVRQRFADFEHPIKQLALGVFTSGTPESVKHFVTGVLSNTITKTGWAKFTITEFRDQIGATIVEGRLAGSIRDLFVRGAASAIPPTIRRVRWSQLDGRPETKWSLGERLPTYVGDTSVCLVAPMGFGKTVASQMAFELAATEGERGKSLRFEARSLDKLGLQSLLRLVCMLCGAGPTWIAIDGLDEVRNDLREDWIVTLAAIENLSNITVFVTVRREVLDVQEWLSDAIVGFPRVEMSLLTASQVQTAFFEAGLPAPANRQLIEVLRNPLLLSLYAGFVTPADMPMAESGDATAFLVIDQFWKRRVRGESIGQRLEGSETSSIERKRKAATYLSDGSLNDETVIARSSDTEIASGIEMLLREGVILECGLDAVTWIHDWLREYAIVQALRSRTSDPTAVSLAKQIATGSLTDAVSRLAASGGMKWVFSNPVSGSPAEFYRRSGM